MSKKQYSRESGKGGFMRRFPIISNLILICVVAALGIWIANISMALFTKHGEQQKVPKVENMSYGDAVVKLHDAGFRVEIRDSLYRDDVRPGNVIEQFPKPGSEVKPGRKIFLYINAVHPKEVIIDDDNNPREYALRGLSMRQGIARLEELGFKNIKVVKVLGDNDCIVKVIANGRSVRKTQKVPVSASIIIEVFDGRLSELRDSLQNIELKSLYQNRTYVVDDNGELHPYVPQSPSYSNPTPSTPEYTPSEPVESSPAEAPEEEYLYDE